MRNAMGVLRRFASSVLVDPFAYAVQSLFDFSKDDVVYNALCISNAGLSSPDNGFPSTTTNMSQFVSTEWCMEGYAYVHENTGSTYALMSTIDNNAGYEGIGLYFNGLTLTALCYAVNPSLSFAIDTKTQYGKFIHVAMSYDNGDWRLFVEGVKVAETLGLVYNYPAPPKAVVGYFFTDDSPPTVLNVLLKDVRFTRKARYTSNFTPKAIGDYTTADPFSADVIVDLRYENNLLDSTGRTWSHKSSSQLVEIIYPKDYAHGRIKHYLSSQPIYRFKGKASVDRSKVKGVPLTSMIGGIIPSPEGNQTEYCVEKKLAYKITLNEGNATAIYNFTSEANNIVNGYGIYRNIGDPLPLLNQIGSSYIDPTDYREVTTNQTHHLTSQTVKFADGNIRTFHFWDGELLSITTEQCPADGLGMIGVDATQWISSFDGDPNIPETEFYSSRLTTARRYQVGSISSSLVEVSKMNFEGTVGALLPIDEYPNTVYIQNPDTAIYGISDEQYTEGTRSWKKGNGSTVTSNANLIIEHDAVYHVWRAYRVKWKQRFFRWDDLATVNYQNRFFGFGAKLIDH
jgi:hypothetical protein